jgi:hypothetical protein
VKQCKGGTQTLTMVCKTIPKEGNTSKTPPTASKGATSSPLPNESEESGCPTPTAPLPPYLVGIGCYSLLPVPGGGGGSHPESIHIPFRLTNLKEIKWDLGSFTNNPNCYIQAFITIIQTIELAWEDVILLLNQTLTSLKLQRVLDQTTQAAMIIIYKSPLFSLPPYKGKLRIPRVTTGPKHFPGQIPDGIPKVRVINGLDTI